MKEYCGNHFILNGELRKVEDFDNSLVLKGETIYEVIRIVRGTPVFFRDHMERLENSVNNQKKRILADTLEIKRSIILLTDREKRKEINVKIVFNYRENDENFLIYYIESTYPTPEQYKKGVKGILFWGERQDPQSKVFNYRLRAAIHQELVTEDAYEALLVNGNDLITEGSKSNVFFVKGDRLFTAPDGCVLKGVTRKHILEICRNEKIDIVFRCVNAEEIDSYDAVFMTGTSPMVLPYCCINDRYFNVNHPVMERLRKSYIERVDASLGDF